MAYEHLNHTYMSPKNVKSHKKCAVLHWYSPIMHQLKISDLLI